MDWFHCNQCFKKSGSKFAVSSCGHICCEGCIKSNQCCICGASCSYLPITDGMKTPEKVFFMDPVKLLQSTIAKISQVAVFQQKQMERVIYHFKNKSSELERRLREFSDQGHRQLSELKKENAELKKQLLELRRETADLRKPLSQRRISPGHFQTNGAQRVSLPVAVTSPVTPRSRTTSLVGSAESQRWNRDRGISLTTPGSIASLSSHSPLHEYRTPRSLGTPTRTQTPVFQFPFATGITLPSPRQ
ncbi:PREDICTED: RING finger protein 212B [Cyprinodon variegatus]|uniref:RING finger protein 212B n=1 Tax=Cyprinodon variegatus TaxID=28743 RepID=UPI0007427F54|nr:PREDICTED: RING finger protein 212B [Cyprinodon variegatus]